MTGLRSQSPQVAQHWLALSRALGDSMQTGEGRRRLGWEGSKQVGVPDTQEAQVLEVQFPWGWKQVSQRQVLLTYFWDPALTQGTRCRA